MTDEPQDICTKARQIALAKRIADRNERDAFVRSIAGDQFTRNDDGILYTICGFEWTVIQDESPYLSIASSWKGLYLYGSHIKSTQDFGEALLKIDVRVKDYEIRFPDTWWGRRKLASQISCQNSCW